MRPAGIRYECANCNATVAIESGDIKKARIAIHTSTTSRMRVISLRGTELHRCDIGSRRVGII